MVNFNLTKKEKEYILETHKKHGYRPYLKEEEEGILNYDNPSDEEDLTASSTLNAYPNIFSIEVQKGNQKYIVYIIFKTKSVGSNYQTYINDTPTFDVKDYNSEKSIEDKILTKEIIDFVSSHIRDMRGSYPKVIPLTQSRDQIHKRKQLLRKKNRS